MEKEGQEATDNEAKKQEVTTSKNMLKKFKKQSKTYMRSIRRNALLKISEKRMENKELSLLRTLLGSETFKYLKNVCTIKTEEEKDSNGNITKPASTRIDIEKLLSEGRYYVALNREERINKGLRKRTTGRSSDRKAHRDVINYLSKTSL